MRHSRLPLARRGADPQPPDPLRPGRRRGPRRVLAPPLCDGVDVRRCEPGRGHRAGLALPRRRVPTIMPRTSTICIRPRASPRSRHRTARQHTTYAKCIGCGRSYDLAWVKKRFDAGGALRCTECDEPIEPQPSRSDGERCRRADGPRHQAFAALRPVCAIGSSLVSLAGCRFPHDGQELRREARHHQPRADRSGRRRRPRDPVRHQGNARSFVRKLIRFCARLFMVPANLILSMRRKRECYLLIRRDSRVINNKCR